VEEDRVEGQKKLRRILAEPVSAADLASHIATLLTSFGKRASRFVVAQRLAEDLASRFNCKSEALQNLIKYRPKELANLAHLAAWDQIKADVLPFIAAQKNVLAKIKTEGERVRRKQRAKNRYEHFERNYVRKPGAIERDFSTGSVLLSRYPLVSPTGFSLDEIFHGRSVTMSGRVDSLQWLFGLRRKRLSMARPLIRRGRKIFYDYRGVVACMDALLKQTGPNAYWLPDPSRRIIVLASILLRARQEAKPRIRKALEKTLFPHLS
jgi:hypothetical protein